MQLAKELDAHSDELLALAGKAPVDLGQTLKESKGARLFYRSAQNMNLSDDDWKEMLEYLRQRRATKCSSIVTRKSRGWPQIGWLS
jgi:hypothetical protein